MAYEWQNSVSSGTLVKDEFYYSISSTYTEVINGHCPSNYTGYNGSQYSNKTDNNSVTNCTANDTTDKSSHHSGYRCTTDRSYYFSDNPSQRATNFISDYDSNYTTNKGSNYTDKSDYGSDVPDSDK